MWDVSKSLLKNILFPSSFFYFFHFLTILSFYITNTAFFPHFFFTMSQQVLDISDLWKDPNVIRGEKGWTCNYCKLFAKNHTITCILNHFVGKPVYKEMGIKPCFGNIPNDCMDYYLSLYRYLKGKREQDYLRKNQREKENDCDISYLSANLLDNHRPKLNVVTDDMTSLSSVSNSLDSKITSSQRSSCSSVISRWQSSKPSSVAESFFSQSYKNRFISDSSDE